MAQGFPQPSPERREAQQVEAAKSAGTHVELDFCDGCGTRFRPSPFNATGVCTQCAVSVYAIRYGA